MILQCGGFVFFFFQAEDGIRDVERSRGLGDVYKRQTQSTWGRNDIRDIGKVAFGLFLLSKFKNSNSKTKEDKNEISLGGEASLDLKDQKLHCEVGTKMVFPKKKVEIQLKMNEKMDCCSSLAIAPKTGVRLIWSEGLNLKGIFSNPAAANYLSLIHI
eukprot:TRINITY_DN22724_c0_g1_i4.p2 TRINITY_DN22724_c0_g1~~TRINITY_DN22724_c0_g1_i4.p2  ORF type:complete len:158 (-),score=35.10 TRINITY_DN22724_c0_g1_i4:154-627(-)